MSDTTDSLRDSLPKNIPVLDTRGENWAIFLVRFRMAVKAKKLWGHFDGSTPRPAPAGATAPTATEAAAMTEWDNHDNTAKYLLSQRIPDSLQMSLDNLPTAAEQWKTMSDEYAVKNAYAQTAIRQDFL
ncbi:hypothetical protein FA95DRAFT_1506505, partial [Auriscalpium vulgare]